jgi:hypothetical protein
VVDRLRTAQADLVVPWPAAEAGVTIVETLRIVLMEATVHLLDLQRTLELAPDVPPAALGSTRPATGRGGPCRRADRPVATTFVS